MVKSQKFDNFISLCVTLNIIGLCVEYYNAPEWYDEMLGVMNVVFVVIFLLEAVLKIIGYGRRFYFMFNQNKFDFFLVVISLLGFFKAYIPLNMTILRVVRGVRILRVFKSLTFIVELLHVLYSALLKFFHVLVLTGISTFCFALIGMGLFGEIKSGPDGGISQETNFRTFYLSMMTLWSAVTGDGWNHFMHDTIIERGLVAVIYWIIFAFVNILVFYNIIVAVLF